jgi:hypothetical protein
MDEVMKTLMKRLTRIALLLVVAGTMLTATGCDGNVYMGVSVAGPYYGYPYGGYPYGGYPYGGSVPIGRPYRW